jgi:hypothetical protein
MTKETKMFNVHLILIVGFSSALLVAAASATDSTEFVDVIDMIDLIVNDAYNGSYLSRTPFRGTDTNISFIPGQFLIISTAQFTCHNTFRPQENSRVNQVFNK